MGTDLVCILNQKQYTATSNVAEDTECILYSHYRNVSFDYSYITSWKRSFLTCCGHKRWTIISALFRLNVGPASRMSYHTRSAICVLSKITACKVNKKLSTINNNNKQKKNVNISMAHIFWGVLHHIIISGHWTCSFIYQLWDKSCRTPNNVIF